MHHVSIGPVTVGNDLPLVFLSGPCQIESRAHALETAAALKEMARAAGVPLIYKSSFDKANRTSVNAARGIGMKEGLAILAEVREATGLPTLTDVHAPEQCAPAAEAVDVLQIEHVIVCGHYGCGGVQAAYHRASFGLIDNWLRHVQDVRDRHEPDIRAGIDEPARIDRLCELNVIEQTRHVCQTTIVQDAWRRGQRLAVHGWIYTLRDGLLRDLHCTVTAQSEVASAFDQAVAAGR